jgi:hypothetical protein
MIDPTATVMAKSKLDILEKLRLPHMRVITITDIYIPTALNMIRPMEFQVNSNSFSIIKLKFGSPVFYGPPQFQEGHHYGHKYN